MMAMMNTIFDCDNNDYRHNMISPYINGTNSNKELHYGNNDNNGWSNGDDIIVLLLITTRIKIYSPRNPWHAIFCGLWII